MQKQNKSETEIPLKIKAENNFCSLECMFFDYWDRRGECNLFKFPLVKNGSDYSLNWERCDKCLRIK